MCAGVIILYLPGIRNVRVRASRVHRESASAAATCAAAAEPVYVYLTSGKRFKPGRLPHAVLHVFDIRLISMVYYNLCAGAGALKTNAIWNETNDDDDDATAIRVSY